MTLIPVKTKNLTSHIASRAVRPRYGTVHIRVALFVE
jgi:hypothetical protein